MRRKQFLALACITGLILMMLSLVSPKSLGVSESRLEQLSQGVNLAHWFAQTELTPETFETRITEADIEQIQSLGFRHVRLPVDPAILMLEDEPTRLNPENLPYVDAALDLIQSHDLAVIVDFHPEPDFKERLYRDAEFVDNVVVFWETWARHLSDRHPEWVFLEVINEPATEDPQDWYAMQERFLAAMRRGAPNHTLIASTNQRVRDDWSPIRALEQLEPVADPNVVYNFHFYEPKHFTHQGASWGWEMLQHYENVPFPATPETVEPLLSSIEDEQAQQFLKNYGEYRWNADRLDELISRAARWGREHRVPVTCNEFGVYRRFAPRGDRLQWIADTRKILEKYDMGWAMWSYDGGFGLLASDVDGDPIPDLEIVEALLGDER